MTPQAASAHLREIARAAPVIPVLVIEDATRAGELAAALVEGGLSVLEITLRTPQSLDALRAMAETPGAIVGAGTVLNPDHARAAQAAGATFAVSPGSTPAVLESCEAIGLPLLPGAATATEAMTLLDRGYSFLKYFPAEAAGGVAVLKSLASPLPQITFCPTGGITPQTASTYLSLPNVACIGGSWVAPGKAVQDGDWSEIRRLARDAAALREG